LRVYNKIAPIRPFRFLVKALENRLSLLEDGFKLKAGLKMTVSVFKRFIS